MALHFFQGEFNFTLYVKKFTYTKMLLCRPVRNCGNLNGKK